MAILSDVVILFAYSESKLTCHFVVLVVVLVAKRSEKVENDYFQLIKGNQI